MQKDHYVILLLKGKSVYLPFHLNLLIPILLNKFPNLIHQRDCRGVFVQYHHISYLSCCQTVISLLDLQKRIHLT